MDVVGDFVHIIMPLVVMPFGLKLIDNHAVLHRSSFDCYYIQSTVLIVLGMSMLQNMY